MDNCVRLCQNKEARINTNLAEGAPGRKLCSFILPWVISQFARNHCSTLIVRVDHDLVWLVDKILCKYVAPAILLNYFLLVYCFKERPDRTFLIRGDFFSRRAPYLRHTDTFVLTTKPPYSWDKQKLDLFFLYWQRKLRKMLNKEVTILDGTYELYATYVKSKTRSVSLADCETVHLTTSTTITNK